MSIQNEIERLQFGIADSYSAAYSKGAELPIVGARTIDNLPTTILSIPSTNKGSVPLDPEEVYSNTRPLDWLPMPAVADDEMYLLFHIPDGVSGLLSFTVECSGVYYVSLGTVINDEFVLQGTTLSLGSGTKYETEIFADNFGNLTSTGMKQVMIKITGEHILTWAPSTHSKKTQPSTFRNWNIVEIVGKLPYATKVLCGGNVATAGLANLTYFSLHETGSLSTIDSMFSYCKSLVAILELDTSKTTNISRIFFGCSSLIGIPELDTSKVTNMSYMFNNCQSLTAIPELDTSSVTNMSRMFFGCYSLTGIPELDTSKVTNMSYMFDNCYSLTAIPELDTSSVTSMSNIFSGCAALTGIPELDTSTVTNMVSMFYGCYSLTGIPELDTSKVTNMGDMFNNCPSLIAIPELDTSKVTNMSNMFSNCPSLIAIPELDTSSVTTIDKVFNACYSLGKVLFNPSIVWSSPQDISLLSCSLGHQALVDLFESLPTLSTAKTLDIRYNPGVSELTSSEKAIATAKNWTLTL